MIDLATLALVVDSTQVEAGNKALERFVEKGDKAEKSAASLGQAFDKQGQSAGQAGNATQGAGAKVLDYTAKTGKAKTETDGLATAQTTLGKETTKASDTLKKQQEATSKAAESTAKLSGATALLRQLYLDVAKAAAAWKVVDFVKDSALLAARYQTMGVVMRIAGNNAGYTMAEMEKLSKTLEKSGISMLQSRNVLTQLATAQIDLAKASELGRAAQNLAVVANINSSEALGRMVQAIQSAEVEILRTMGMNVSWEAAYKKMAAQIGTTSDKLTEQQKVVARTNAVLEQATRYNGIYEESMTTAGKALASLTRYWEDFKVKAGEVFLPILADAVFTWTDALKAANKELEKAGSAGTVSSIGESLSKAFRVVTQTVLVLGANVGYVFSGIGREIGAILAQASALARLDFRAVVTIRKELIADNEAAKRALEAYETSVMSASKAQTKAASKTEEERIAAAKTAKELADAEAKRLAASDAASKAGKKEAESYRQLSSSIQEAIIALQLETQGYKDLTPAQQTALRFVTDLATGQLALSDAHKRSATQSLEQLIALEKTATALRSHSELLKAIRQPVVSAEDATLNLNEAQKVLRETMRSPVWATYTDEMKRMAVAETEAATASLKLIERRQRIKELMDSTPTAQLERQRDLMKDLAAEYENGRFGLVGSSQAMEKFNEAAQTALGTLPDQVKESTDAFAEFREQALKNTQDALAEFLFDPFSDGMDGMLKKFGDTIRKMVAEWVAADLMKRLTKDGGLEGMATSIAGVFGGGSTQGKAESGGDLFDSLSSSLTNFWNSIIGADSATKQLATQGLAKTTEAAVKSTIQSGVALTADQKATASMLALSQAANSAATSLAAVAAGGGGGGGAGQLLDFAGMALGGYQLGTGTLGNAAAIANGFEPLNHAALASSFIDPFAKGGAFGDGEILTGPTFFKFAEGGEFRTGVAGEAGPEGALPLKRMSNGKLGVYADGATKAQPQSTTTNNISVSVSVANASPQEARRAGAQVAREVDSVLARVGRYR